MAQRPVSVYRKVESMLALRTPRNAFVFARDGLAKGRRPRAESAFVLAFPND